MNASRDAGEDAWAKLASSDPGEVAARALVGFDAAAGKFVVEVLGRSIFVHPERGLVEGDDDEASALLERRSDLLPTILVHYLVGASDAPLAGRLVTPSSVRGGDMFCRGTHALPLDRLAEAYLGVPEKFVERGLELGGRKVDHGDVAVELRPVPRVPVLVAFWDGDEEFPPRASVFFDASCEAHLSGDVLWAAATICVREMFPSGTC